MLHKPNLPDHALAATLRAAYALEAVEIEFLPLGADWSTAVYRVVADDGDDKRAYFLKLRSGPFDDTAVVVSRQLYEDGVPQVIPPLPTGDGQLWTHVDQFALVLCPFVEAENAYTYQLSAPQWRQLGEVLRRIHAARLPEPLAARIPRDTFAPTWIDALRHYEERAHSHGFDDPVDPIAADLVAALQSGGERIRKLIRRTEELGRALIASPPVVALSHGDWHPGNALISPDGALYVVDWDNVVFAPRERDLSLIGLTWGGEREAALFYDGYGPIEPDGLDQVALTYYRYHRVVEDIAVDCAALLDTPEGGASRAKTLASVAQWLQPGGRIDGARHLDVS